MEWPPKSPDLSPIEQVWSYIKNRITGTNFTTEQELYNSLRSIWWSVPNEILENFHSSFLVRCIIVSQIQGNSLNGSWKKVHEVHNTYVTEI